jgi:3-hydroxyacyl-[acyl-carrier-protein] dehydratase
MLDNNQLKKILPHAYPFVLLDRVERYIPGQSLVAIKNITANEWPFLESPERLEHYPETLLIEAAAQAALVLYGIGGQTSDQ